MMVTLVLWLYVTTTCWVVGRAAWKGVQRMLGAPPVPLEFIDTCLVGLAVIGIAASYWICGARLGGAAACGSALAACFCAWGQRAELAAAWQEGATRWRRSPLLNLTVFGLVLVTVFIWTSGPALTFDTGLYHAQAVRWLEEYPLVPGLGNLHIRLAYPSSWFALNALFGFAWLLPDPRHLLNGVLATWMVLPILSAGVAGRRTTPGVPAFLDGLLILFTMGLKHQFSSPSPDLPVVILTWRVLRALLEMGSASPDRRAALMLFSMLIAAFLPTIKLTALPIGLALAVVWWRAPAGQRRRWAACTGGTLVLIYVPWLVQSFCVSGYWVFPVRATGWGQVDWRIPPGAVKEVLDTIETWARVRDHASSAEVARGGLAFWLPIWWKTQQEATRLLVVLSGAVLMVFLVSWLGRRRWPAVWHRMAGPLIVPASLALVGMVFWFHTAPDGRFGYGWLVFFCAAPLSLSLNAICRDRPGRVRSISSLLLLVTLIVGFQKIGRRSARWSHWLLPAPYDRPAMRKVNHRGMDLWIPQNGSLSYYAAFPAVPSLNTNCAPRGRTPRSGFVSQTE